MPRKGEVPKRRVLPDPKFTDAPLDVRRRITKFINVVMSDGKKSTAEQIVYKSLDLVAERAKDDPIKVWDRALGNVRPKVEVKSRRDGGSTYQVPVDVRPDRSLALGMRWLIEHARKRNEKTMIDRLANEIVDAAQNRGNAVKKREDVHKMADANKEHRGGEDTESRFSTGAKQAAHSRTTWLVFRTPLAHAARPVPAATSR